jgi:hypothetical protein
VDYLAVAVMRFKVKTRWGSRAESGDRSRPDGDEVAEFFGVEMELIVGGHLQGQWTAFAALNIELAVL